MSKGRPNISFRALVQKLQQSRNTCINEISQHKLINEQVSL
jgi:hypothetical protein